MPAIPPVTSAASLPEPRGIIGHFQYSWAAFQCLRAWRRQLLELDEALRSAVEARDTHLAALGQAAAAAEVPALVGFRQTLAALEAERTEATAAREAAAVALTQAEAEVREVLAQHDRAVEGQREALVPLERQLRSLRSRQESLEQAAALRTSQRRNLEVRRVRLEEKLAETELAAEERAALAEELAGIGPRLEALEHAGEADTAELAALAEPLATLRAEVHAAGEGLEAAREARRNARLSSESRLADLAAALRGAQNHEEALARRRQAVLVDLGHASLERPELELAGRDEATAALGHIEALRTARAQLERARAELDRRPLWRTVGATATAVVVLLLVWSAW